jgi:hypothetical protein
MPYGATDVPENEVFGYRILFNKYLLLFWGLFGDRSSDLFIRFFISKAPSHENRLFTHNGFVINVVFGKGYCTHMNGICKRRFHFRSHAEGSPQFFFRNYLVFPFNF